MNTPFQINDVIQWTEEHKWCGLFGIITEIKECGDDIRYMIGCPTFTEDGKIGTAYIFEMESTRRFEYIGKAAMIHADNED